MATSYKQPSQRQLISTKDVRKCLEIMQDIRRQGKPVAIDAEGVRLGAHGRMTLLQICTWDKRVYLLDLMDPDYPDDPQIGKKLLENGGVEAMLMSSEVEKVTHSCSNDSSALNHQFDIKLDSQQIFDTQVADQVLQSLEGTVFPKRKNLDHMAEFYSTPRHPLKEAHGNLMEEDKEAWGKRPLSEDMLDYATYDVTILVPELYNELKKRLDQKGGWPLFRQMVNWTVNHYTDRDRVQTERAKSQTDGVRKLFNGIQTNYTASTPVDDLTDDERSAVRGLHENREFWARYSNLTVKALEEVIHVEFIAELKKEVAENPPEHDLGGYRKHRLYILGKHPNPKIREPSCALQKVVRANKEKSGGGRGGARGGHRGRTGRRY